MMHPSFERILSSSPEAESPPPNGTCTWHDPATTSIRMATFLFDEGRSRQRSSEPASAMNEIGMPPGAGRNLEDAFFLKEDKKLLERLQALKRLSETKETLAKVSGIQDDAILQRLIDLDVQPGIVASLKAIPLVEVAWADGKVDEKERKAVLAAAESEGIRRGDIEYELLDAWLARRPEPKLLDAWKHYIEGLCAALSPEERTTLKRELLDHARSVAAASGGFLGLTGNKISQKEAEMLRVLEASFEVDGTARDH